jgi:hypothetical protein
MVCRSGGCGLLVRLALATGVIAATLSPFRRRARRLDWELQATDEEPEGPCGSGRHVHSELTLKPGRRTVAHLDLEARNHGEDVLRRRIEGRLADRLNAAVQTYRRNAQAAAEVKEALLPVSRELAGQIETWLVREADDRRDVFVRAHLRDGKAVWTYTPWRCVRGRWRRGRAWTVDVADERDEPAALVTHPYPVAVAA